MFARKKKCQKETVTLSAAAAGLYRGTELSVARWTAAKAELNRTRIGTPEGVPRYNPLMGS